MIAGGDDSCDESGKPSTPSFLLCPQSIIITSVANWQPLPMHRLQNSVSTPQYPNNKEERHKSYLLLELEHRL